MNLNPDWRSADPPPVFLSKRKARRLERRAYLTVHLSDCSRGLSAEQFAAGQRDDKTATELNGMAGQVPSDSDARNEAT